MIFVSDEFGMIKAVEKIPDKFFEIAENRNILMPYKRVSYGSVGNVSAGHCLANHVHPYSRDWMLDTQWTNLVNDVNILQQSIAIRIRQGILDFAIKLSEISVYLIKIYLTLLTEFAKLLPALIPFFILILEAIAALGGHVLKGENGEEYETEKMIEELEKMTK